MSNGVKTVRACEAAGRAGLLRHSMHVGVSPRFYLSICQISLNRTGRTCTCFTVHTVFSSPYLSLVTGSMDTNIFRIICRVCKRRKRGVSCHSETDGHRQWVSTALLIGGLGSTARHTFGGPLRERLQYDCKSFNVLSDSSLSL